MTALLRRHAVAVGFVLLLLVVAIATGSLLGPTPRLRSTVGTGLDAVVHGHNVLSLVTAALFASGPVVLVIDLVVAVVAMGAAERLLGHARTALAAVVTTALGIAAGLGLQAAGILVRGVWSQAPPDTVVLDPLIPVTGVVMAASAFAGPLWRRRVRLLGFTGLIVVLLYSDEPADAYRLAAGVVGVALGWVLARRLPRPSWRRSSHHEIRSLLAAVVGVTAAGPFVALTSRSGYGPLRPLGLLFRDSLPGPRSLALRCAEADAASGCARRLALVQANGPGAAIMPVLLLGALLAAAWGMWHGRRAAAIIAVVLDGAIAILTAVSFGVVPAVRRSLAGHAASGAPTLQAVLAAFVPAAVAAAVVLGIRHFDVMPRRRTVVLLGVAVGGVFAVGAVTDVAVGLLPGQFAARVDVATVLRSTLERYVPIGFLHLDGLTSIASGRPAHLVGDWIGPLLWLVVLAGAVVVRFDVADTSVSDSRRLRALLRTGGPGSISYMATWAANRTWFSDDGGNAIAYREVGSVALALGEPIGAPEGRVEAARAFAVTCDDRGLTPAFYAVSPAFARRLSDSRRWATVAIAEDTIVDPGALTMVGKRWADVRTSMRRARRLGVSAYWTSWDGCSTAQRTQIVAMSEEWVAGRGLPELGFTLGGVDELRDAAVGMMLAIDADGHVLAATSWLPTWRDGVEVGWTLDFMRRSPQGMNGLMEFLIASVLELARDRGLEFVSLSASPLSIPSEPDDGLLERLLGLLGNALEPAYGFSSLAAFKGKFQPALTPLVLAYPDALALPATAAALTRAYLPHLTPRAAIRIVTAFR